MRMRKKISQREALRLRKRVNQLLQERATERRQWSLEYPGGVNLGRIDLTSVAPALSIKLDVASKFADVLVAKRSGSLLELFAIPR